MFNSLFSNTLGWAAKVFDFLITWVLKMLSFNLSFFTTNFPVIDKLYVILQGVAIGLVIAIGSVQLFKYFTGPLSDVRSNPVEIAIRMMLAFAMIWFGNYFLEAIINLFTYPYQALLAIDPYENSTIMGSAADALAGLIQGSAGIVLSLILVIILGYNLIKLLLEIIERYLMVGVLTYTSPLAWTTLTSRGTQTIFTKWFVMFFGQCLLMLLNVWSIKMLISVLTYDAANIFFRFIIALAFCKIAQRIDTYLQQLGIGVATTGGGLMGELVAVGSSLAGTSKIAGGIATGMGNKALGQSLIKGGWSGGIAHGIGSFIGNKQASDTAAHIPNTPLGSESKIFRNVEGGYSWQDKNGNLWSSNNYKQAEGVRAAVQRGYAQYEGESGIARDARGNYTWTDANGNEHTSNSLTGMLAKQQAVRAAYAAGVRPMSDDSDIVHGDDGKYHWTDKNGHVHSADTLEAMKAQKASIISGYGMDGTESEIVAAPNGGYQWTDKYGNVHSADTLEGMEAKRAEIRAHYQDSAEQGEYGSSVGNIRNKDMSAYAASLFDSNGAPKAGVTTITPEGNEIIASKDDKDAAAKIANISNPSAMATAAGQDSISAIKAATVAAHGAGTAQALMRSNIQGGITDERVVGATFDKLFNGGGAGNSAENGVDSVIPGISNAVSSANGEMIEGSGDAYDLKMNNGEISGSYTPVDEAGNEGATQQFSIRTQESYSGLSGAEQSGYTEFVGTDGDTYYARSSVEINDEPVRGSGSVSSSPVSSATGVASTTVEGGTSVRGGAPIRPETSAVEPAAKRTISPKKDSYVTRQAQPTIENRTANNGDKRSNRRRKK